VGRESDESHDDPLLLLPEVAELCRMSESTLRWLRHRGEGPPGFRMGRRILFRRSAVHQWIAEHEKAQ
jgi:excisionase family DNA binding protein